MQIIFYLMLLYVGIGLQVGGLYIFMNDLLKALTNETKISNVSDFMKYLVNQIISVIIAALIWPKTICNIVKFLKNVKNNIWSFKVKLVINFASFSFYIMERRII